ncbi:hypothetical protein ACLQ22_00540 [Micromonospora sp. DT178]|uniref:hypothetical protein n=1 Tax=Micromonospora sp. DT178 TaxID=3393436 RepID=UPI003CEAA59C
MTSSGAEQPPVWPAAEHVPAAELACRQGIQPVASVDDLARSGLFGPDEELDAFLADLYASRRAGHPGSLVVLDTDVACSC